MLGRPVRAGMKKGQLHLGPWKQAESPLAVRFVVPSAVLTPSLQQDGVSTEQTAPSSSTEGLWTVPVYSLLLAGALEDLNTSTSSLEMLLVGVLKVRGPTAHIQSRNPRVKEGADDKDMSQQARTDTSCQTPSKQRTQFSLGQGRTKSSVGPGSHFLDSP